ncbi:MAG: nucleotide disphospho-sugar-binding domain-containing protein, partial [Solirubrobacteraceae bacterium]
GFEAVEAPSANFLVVAAMLARLTRDALLADAVATLRAWSPDVVLIDSMAPWGLVAARQLGLPVVTSTSSFVVHGGLGTTPDAIVDIARRLPGGVAALASMTRSRVVLRHAAGVDPGGPIRLLSNRADATVVYTSRALQPGADRLGPDVHYVGATIADPHPDGLAADGAAPHRSAADAALLDAVGDGPLIYVSLGTLYNDRPAFYRACIDALALPGRPLVLSIGARTDRAELGPLPPGVHVTRFAPQLELLRRAELFVTHGGMNSVHEALWHGVPMVVFPQAADQPVVGARIAALGAGRVLRGREPSAAAIRDAAARVLAGGVAAGRAAGLGATLRDGGGAQRAADLILDRARVAVAV